MKTLIRGFFTLIFISFAVSGRADPSSNDVQRASIVWLTNTVASGFGDDFSGGRFGSGDGIVTQITTNGTETTITSYQGGSGSGGGFSMFRSDSFDSFSEDIPAGCYAPGSGLIAWWQGETNAIDSVGTYNGTPINGASLDSGEVGSAFTLNGTDQAVLIGYSTNLASANFTIEGWVNPQGEPGGFGQAFLFGQGFGRQLDVTTGDDDGTVYVNLYVTDQYGGFHGLFGDEIPLGEWTHLAGTWDGTTLSLYINGVLDAQAEPGLSATGDSGCLFCIGAGCDCSTNFSQFFNGLLDEVSLYDRALIDCEIAAIYNAGSDGKCHTAQACAVLPNSTIAEWKGDGDASDLFQSSDGTLQSGAGFVSGVVSQAFSFHSGSDQAVEIPYVPALATSAFSIEAWINPTSQLPSPADHSFIFGQSFGRQLVMRGGVAGLAARFAISTDTTHFQVVDGTGEIPIGEWTHLVGTWDGTNMDLFINGALDNQATPGTLPWDSGCAFHIGGVGDPSGDCAYVGQFFDGLVDEVTLYSGALTADQVRAAYNAGTAGKCLDSDSDGMPDWWEIKYFGDLSYTATGDYDGDGVSNYLEYVRGRNPTVAGTTADTSGLINLEVYTPLK